MNAVKIVMAVHRIVETLLGHTHAVAILGTTLLPMGYRVQVRYYLIVYMHIRHIWFNYNFH